MREDAWWQPLLTAARRNLVPGLCLQAIAVILVGIYYFVPATHGPFETVARWKVDGGYFFAAISTALAAAIQRGHTQCCSAKESAIHLQTCEFSQLGIGSSGI